MFDITLNGPDAPKHAAPLQFPIVPRPGDYLELGPDLQFRVVSVRMQPSYDGAVVEVERVPTAQEEERLVVPGPQCGCQDCQDAHEWTELTKERK